MKTSKIILESIKDTDGWYQLAYELKFEAFKKEHPFLDEDTLHEFFHEQVVHNYFQYGEYANIEIEIDENFNIVGGEILKLKKENVNEYIKIQDEKHIPILRKTFIMLNYKTTDEC